MADSVVEEFREINDRHDFLVHQSDDLRAAMAELQQAAAELEAHMRDRFAAVFEATQTAFQECFAQLFGGGEARLVLTQPDDMLRTGVDIVARPPGKKLQGLLSLSGGERALTVVALLFGLLRSIRARSACWTRSTPRSTRPTCSASPNLLAEFARRDTIHRRHPQPRDDGPSRRAVRCEHGHTRCLAHLLGAPAGRGRGTAT